MAHTDEFYAGPALDTDLWRSDPTSYERVLSATYRRPFVAMATIRPHRRPGYAKPIKN